MTRSRLTLRIGAALLSLSVASAAHADMAAAKRWVEKEFQPSTLTKEQHLKEMELACSHARAEAAGPEQVLQCA